MKKLKVVPSIFWIIWVTFLVSSLYAILIFTYTYPPAHPTEVYDHLLIVFCTGVLPTAILILAVPRGVFSVVTISEAGVKRSTFGLFKLEMTWEEMAEIRFFWRVMPFLFFSKTSSLEGMTYDRIIKKKDVIQVALKKKVYNAIRQYTEKEIINLPKSFEEGQ